MQEKNIITITNTDSRFPPAFKLLSRPPVSKFYALGNLDLLSKTPRLGVVGSRKMTSYGREITTELSRKAAAAGAVIVSGLALGVDGTAHQAALDTGGHTVAVIPSSLYKIYPANHEYLARRIVEDGGLLITEFKKEEKPMKHYFIQRNRLIGALSEVLLVTEAAMGSGTRHTVEFNIAQGREPVAVPGEINKYSSSYTNHMIQNGCKPIFSARDLLKELGLNENFIKPKFQPENAYEKAILAPLEKGTLTFNELFEASKLAIQACNITLTMLEIKGAIEHINGKWRLK